MERMLLALDPAVGVSPESFAAAWEADEEARRLGPVGMEAAPGQQFIPGLIELIVIPMVVGVSTDVLTDLIRRLVRRRQPPQFDDLEYDDPKLEVAETMSRGDRILVVRLRGPAS
jgi:hypothetical protein